MESSLTFSTNKYLNGKTGDNKKDNSPKTPEKSIRNSFLKY